MFPRSSDTVYIVTYYIKWVTTSWTHSIIVLRYDKKIRPNIYKNDTFLGKVDIFSIT